MFGAGALAQVAEETARLGFERALLIATPGSGARLGQQLLALVGHRAAGLYPHAVMHVPKPVADAARVAAQAARSDALIAAGGGAAIGLAKVLARDLGLPILAVPTTYSGSEATAIWGESDGERKSTGRDPRVLPRTIVYDPDLTLTLPAAVSAASGMNALAHCVGGLSVADRTPVTIAYALEAARRLATHLPRVVENGSDRQARGECLIAAWLAGMVLVAGTGLQHKLAHVLGGLGLPHAQTHAIILPHVTRFNMAAAPARERLADALGAEDPAECIAAMLDRLPYSAAAARGRVRSPEDRLRGERDRLDVDQRAAAGLDRGRTHVAARRLLESSSFRDPGRSPLRGAPE